MYKSTDKMSLLMGAGSPKGSTDSQVLQLIHRFGIPLGVGDKTIEQVCQEANIDCHTLLTVVHFAMGKEYHHEGEIHIPTLRLYLENAHLYFMSFQYLKFKK